jgi:glutathione peroxidase
VASQCGFTEQYQSLQRLYDKFLEKNFSILAFPCNDFLNQEPGSGEEILEFCDRAYGVKFDVF